MKPINKLSHKIIGSAIKVHKELGSGFLESIYQNALSTQFQIDNLNFEEQKSIEILFKQQNVGFHILDFLVEDKIIVEIKAVKEINKNHISQVLSYLRATGLKLALILNFSKSTLEIKRLVNDL